MSQERSLFPASELFDPSSLSPDQISIREAFVIRMLEEVDEILVTLPENSRSIFILFYGLNGEYGKWYPHRIADHFGMSMPDVLKIVSEIHPLLSEAHLNFVRTYKSSFC